MPSFIRSKEELSQDEIFRTLMELRNHSVVPLSGYRVSTLVHYKKWGLNIYVPGFNKEEKHLPNRFSSHGEQSAIGFGSVVMGDEKIHAVYIMAAPGNAVPDPTQTPGKSCGHCRQIMLSLAERGVKIYVVALDGRFLPPDSFYGVEKPFLPDPFNQQDLNLQPELASNPDLDIDPSRLQAWHILTEAQSLPDDVIKEYLFTLKPHWVDKKFQTSPVTACVVECQNDQYAGRYAAGVLLQDVAFLTTETSFVTVNNAIIQYGQENLRFNKIYVASDTLNPAELFTFDIKLWRDHVNKDTIVHVYTPDNKYARYTFEECMLAYFETLRFEPPRPTLNEEPEKEEKHSLTTPTSQSREKNQSQNSGALFRTKEQREEQDDALALPHEKVSLGSNVS